MSTAFATTLGHGINVAPHARITSEEWSGLARRVDHVRLCGDVVSALINWSSCPGETIGASGLRDDAHVVRMLRRQPGYTDFVAAAQEALRAGLRLVLNPMHRLLTLEVRGRTHSTRTFGRSELLKNPHWQVNARTLRWVWTAMLLDFTLQRFPPSRVAFELVNEPGNTTSASLAGGSWISLISELAERIGAASP